MKSKTACTDTDCKSAPAGAAATPYVIGAGVIYGVISVAGGDEWLNSNFDISDQINFIKP